MSAWGANDDVSDDGDGFGYFSEDDIDEDDDAVGAPIQLLGDPGDDSEAPLQSEKAEDDSDELSEDDGEHLMDLDDAEEDITIPTTASIEDAMDQSPVREALFGVSVDGLAEPKASKKRKKSKCPRALNIPKHLEHIMGQANVAYAHNNFVEAIQLLKQVVKEAPWVVSPYHTLGLIHQDMGDEKKALDFFMIASHKNPRDVELWKRNASAFFNNGDIDRSIYCLTRGFAASGRKDMDFVRARANLYKDHRNHPILAGNSFSQVYKSNPAEVEAAISAARCYIRGAEPARAIDVLITALENVKVGETMNNGDNQRQLEATRTNQWLKLLSLLSQLYMGVNQFSEAGLLLARSRLQAESDGTQLPADLLIRADVAKLWQNPDHEDLCTKISGSLLQLSPCVVPDIFREAVDCFMGTSNVEEALQLTEAMIEGEEFAEDITTRIVKGACLFSLGRLGDAISEFELVLDLDPENITAMQALSAIRQSKAAPASVMTARFSSSEKSRRVAERCGAKMQSQKIAQILVRGVMPKANDLFTQGDLQGYFDTLGPLFTLATVSSRSFAPVNVSDETGQPVTVSTAALFAAFHSDLDERSFVEAMEMYWVASFQCGNRYKAHGQLESMMLTKKYNDEALAFRARMTLLCSALGARKYNTVTRYCQRDWNNKLAGPELIYALWKNSSTVHGPRDQHKIQRNFHFMTRKYWENPQCAPAMVISASCAQDTHITRTALQRYRQASVLRPSEPILYLLSGVEMMMLAMGRLSSNRHLQILRSAGLMSMYREKRLGAAKKELMSTLTLSERAKFAEGSYNMGRVLHYAGLKHAAVALYREAIRVLSGSTEGLDLRREAAFNLSQIYAQSGSSELANAVLRQHLYIW